MIDQDSSMQAGQPAAPIRADPGQDTGQESGSKRPDMRPGSPIALTNWPVRWRLLALVAIPTVTTIALGGIRVAAAIHSARAFLQVEHLAVLGGDVANLAQAMEDERDITARFIAVGRPRSGQVTLRRRYAVTDSLIATVRSHAAGIGSGYPAGTREQLAAVLASIDHLRGLRRAALQNTLTPPTMITDYSQAITAMFAFNDEIAQGSTSSTLSDSVRTLGLLSRMKDQASQQRAILYAALAVGSITPEGLGALNAARMQQATDLSTLMASTSVGQGQQQRYADTVKGAQDDLAQNLEQHAITLGSSNAPLLAGATSGHASQQWYSAMSATIRQMRAAETQVVGSIIAQSRALRRGADRSALITGIVVPSILVLVPIITAIIARSIVRPLRRLQAGALDVAGTRLPEKVRQLSETGGDGETLDVEPIDVTSTDEVGEVARAFDLVHHEALRVAANVAIQRSNLSAMFVSLSSRSRSLVERQIKLIDELEQGEQDAERLSDLFRLDHLATRMRRNSDKLLMLAGHDTEGRWGKPVMLVDVLRAAVSEIEQYKRVTLSIQPGTPVAGKAVNDVVHLLAELLENAASYSPGDTPVEVAGHPLASGGVLLDVTDHGVGMGAQEMAHANWRLENPPVVDVTVSSRMGLFVVARLAARHGIRVRLRRPELGGLTALIWLPDSLISQETKAPTTGLRHVGKVLPGQLAGVDASAPSRRAAVKAPALPANDLPAGRTAEIDGRPIRAADYKPIHRADTGPTQAVQPMRQVSPVVIPAGALGGPAARLPIYDLLESDWFHRRGRSLQGAEALTDSAQQGVPAAALWQPASDEGWRAAKRAAAPSADGVTSAGLPRRVPQANIVPGSAGTLVSAAANPELSAESARNRMASFQYGLRRARAAIATEHPPNR